MRALEHTSFPKLAERVSALYNEDEDALLLGMLGQEYVIRRKGVFLHGQHAPEAHGAIILDYLFSSGVECIQKPWRAIGDFTDQTFPEFRKKVELPMTTYAAEIMSRAGTILPMIDAQAMPSLVGGDLAIAVRALPKIYLHVELSQETQDFPPEVWVLFSNNAHEFLPVRSMHMLAELFKDRLLSLIRIY